MNQKERDECSLFGRKRNWTGHNIVSGEGLLRKVIEDRMERKRNRRRKEKNIE